MSDVSRHAAEIAEKGYTIVENAIEDDLVAEIDETLIKLEKDLAIVPAANPFEGTNTVRIYNLLVHGKVFEKIPVHARILPIVESVLDPGCLVSSLSSISIDPGESPQPIHADDQLIPLSKPHSPIVCNTMWAITDFTEANGATRLMPGTHLADSSPIFGTHYVCDEVEGFGLIVDHVTAVEGRQFSGRFCATPFLYAAGSPYAVGNQVCSSFLTGEASWTFPLNQYFPDGTQVCVKWDDSGDMPCVTVHS